MKTRLTIILMIFALGTASSNDAKKDTLENDIHAYAQMASSFLNEANTDNLGGIISNLVQSEGGKQLGDMLMGMGNNKNTNQILQSLGSLISQSGGANGGFDPTILTSMLNVFQTSETDGKKQDGADASDLLSMFGNLMGQEGGMETVMGVLPLLMNTVSSFTGDEAQKRIDDHSSHSWYLPPVLEKVHLLFDHFMNSELGKSLMKSIGTEKFIKVFTDANGKFNFSKFLQLLENHSFRKHWIEMVTRRIAVMVSYFADPKIQKRFLTTVQYFINSFLKSQGFPKSSMFDPAKPTETLSAFLNFMFKKYLGYKINAKQYVKPAVDYVQSTGKEILPTQENYTDTQLELLDPINRNNSFMLHNESNGRPGEISVN
ncbi:hypothetical protein ILUMI_13567 [Ignelater luminosus]|uniref:Uncharacterized protein n=1 Tax=Ignelater luminosus TaxID=2038154 RepID=A0A8K0CU81_IGNLU|nr:hypothetical protein ILUMI_13567 [Ignelater luminosus]